MPELFAVGVVIVPEPLISVHKPVPVAATLPDKVVLVPQTFSDPPALATVGDATPVMVTCDELGAHGLFEMVH